SATPSAAPGEPDVPGPRRPTPLGLFVGDDIVLGMPGAAPGPGPGLGASAAGADLPVLSAEPRATAEPRALPQPPAPVGQRPFVTSSPNAPEFSDSTLVKSPSQDLIDQTIRDPSQDLEETFQRVYHDFVELKRKCGESTDSVTFERFVTKLRDNRDQLMR